MQLNALTAIKSFINPDLLDPYFAGIMADSFNLPIEFNGKELTYPAQVMRYEFTHNVHVMTDSVLVVF